MLHVHHGMKSARIELGAAANHGIHGAFVRSDGFMISACGGGVSGGVIQYHLSGIGLIIGGIAVGTVQ